MRKLGIIIIFCTFILDQISKYIVVDYFSSNFNIIKLTSFFNVVLVYNKGISFGLFNNLTYSNYLFSILSLSITYFLLKWLRNSAILLEIIALGMIIGGALGNIVDRILYLGVVDFIQLHWQEFYWPSFNVADSAICIGVLLLIILNLINENKTKITEEKST